MKKTITITTIVLFLSFLSLTLNVNASEAFTLTDLEIDTSITRKDENFNLPTRIVIVPITPPSGDLDVNDTEWLRGIYYYTIDYLGFSDVPFHYFVTKTGEIIEGNSGGDERKISVKGIGDDIILIAYLSDKFANTFDPRAEESIKQLSLDIANKNTISSDKILVSGVRFIKDKASQSVFLDQDKIFGNWETDINKIRTFVAANYTPIPKEYSVSISNVTVSKSEVVAGEVVTAEITLKNNGLYGIYFGTKNEIIATKLDGATSRFYVNGEWLSQNQFSIMSENESLNPGQEKTFSFNVRAPLFTGENLETFELKNVSGSKINSDSFVIFMNVVSGNKRIVEVSPRSGSYSSIKSDPNNGSSEVLRGYPGDRFFFLQDLGNGWIQIDLGNGQVGWIASWNLKFI